MDNTNGDLIAEARQYVGGDIYPGAQLMHALADRLEAAEAELTRRHTLLRRAIQAGRDMHPIYGSTAACGGGIGGQAMTQHCAVVCENPKHDEAKEAWHQIERDFFALAAAPVSLEAVKAETTTEWGVRWTQVEPPAVTDRGADEADVRRLVQALPDESEAVVREVTEWSPVSTERDTK